MIGNETATGHATPKLLLETQPRRGSEASLSTGEPPSPSARAERLWLQHEYWHQFWTRNQYVLLVASAQLFAALMNLAAGLLEVDGDGMHPLQIIFARMGLTTVLSCIYMYWMKVPGFPSGPSEIRPLLIVRGVCGFLGIYGMWYSMIYLPLAEATVLTFLVPSLSGYICYFLLRDSFTAREQLASVVALVGVIMIADPVSSFLPNSSAPPSTSAASNASKMLHPRHQYSHEDVTAVEHLTGVGMALVGVVGTAGAFVTIRHIGKRAHPLILVNYYSALCTVITTFVLGLAPLLDIWQPVIRFAFPQSAYQWCLFFSLGVSGFTMQFLLTSGLSGEKSNRATLMLYTEIVFAAGFDRWIFGNEMKLLSFAGCTLIIGSAVWIAITKNSREQRTAADIELEPAITESSDLEMAALQSEEREETVTECKGH